MDGELFLFSEMATVGKLRPVLARRAARPPRSLGSGSCTLRFPLDPGARAVVEALCAKWSPAGPP